MAFKTNYDNDSAVYGTTDNDTIGSYGSRVTIYGYGGNDYFYFHSGNQRIADGGAGNDSIDASYTSYSTLKGGDGNDSIVNLGSNGSYNVADGGDGDDVFGISTLFNSVSNVTIIGGSGNDTLQFGPSPSKTASAVIKDFVNGDVIYNNSSNYADVNALSCSTANGNLILKDDYNTFNLTLQGFTDESQIRNITYKTMGSSITLGEILDKAPKNITNYTDYKVINGGSANDTIYNNGHDVTISSGAGDDRIENSSYNVSIDGGTGNDYIEVQGSRQTVKGGSGDDVLVLYSYLTYNLVQYANGDGNDTISGFGSDDTLHITSGNISSSVISGNDLILTVGSGSIKLQDVKGSTINLKLANGMTTTLKAEEETPAWTVSGTTATYGTSSQTLCTVTGLKSGTSTSNLSLSGSTVTVKAAALGTSKVSISGSYTLALASDVTKPSTTSGGFTVNGTTATYTSEGTSAGYTLASDSKSISYTSASDGNTLFTVSGLKSGTSTNNLSLSGSTVTVKAAALGTSKVSISGNYKLALANDVTKPSTTSGGFTVSGTTATYTSEGTSAGYVLSSDKKSVSYESASDGNTLFTISGLKKGTSASNLSLSGSTVTVKAAALGTSKVSISGNYKLALANDVTKPSTTSGSFTVSGTTATYTSEGTSAGYVLSSDKKSVSYESASDGDTLFTISGLKKGTSASNLSLNGSTVTVKAAALGSSKVSIGGNYTLKLADDVSKSSKKKAAWTYNNSTATYKGSYKTAGYSLASDGKSISYTKATSAKNLATIKGAKSKKGISLSGKKITLKKTALSNKVTVSGSYEFNFASGYKNATITGTKQNDTITAQGSKIKIFGGKGNDSIKMVGTNQTVSGGNGADTFIYAASGGKEIITDFSENDTLKIGAEGTETYSTKTIEKNVIVTVGKGEVTLVGAAGKSLNIVGTKKNSGKGVKVSGKKITLTSSYDENSFSLSGNYSSAVTVDASAALIDLNITGNKFANRIIGSSQDDTIDGGAGADTLYGGKGNDSIFGGKGNDSIFGGIGKDTLWGGEGDDELYGDDGKDVFYYNTGEGNDTIFGYEASVDKIILGSGKIDNVAPDDNNNVIFTIGDGQLVIHQGKVSNSNIQILDTSGNQVKNGLWPR